MLSFKQSLKNASHSMIAKHSALGIRQMVTILGPHGIPQLLFLVRKYQINIVHHVEHDGECAMQHGGSGTRRRLLTTDISPQTPCPTEHLTLKYECAA